LIRVKRTLIMTYKTEDFWNTQLYFLHTNYSSLEFMNHWWRKAILKVTIFDDRIQSADLGLLLFTLELDLKRCLATGWTIGTENCLLLGFPSTAPSSLAQNAGYAERICIELSI